MGGGSTLLTLGRPDSGGGLGDSDSDGGLSDPAVPPTNVVELANRLRQPDSRLGTWATGTGAGGQAAHTQAELGAFVFGPEEDVTPPHTPELTPQLRGKNFLGWSAAVLIGCNAIFASNQDRICLGKIQRSADLPKSLPLFLHASSAGSCRFGALPYCFRAMP